MITKFTQTSFVIRCAIIYLNINQLPCKTNEDHFWRTAWSKKGDKTAQVENLHSIEGCQNACQQKYSKIKSSWKIVSFKVLMMSYVRLRQCIPIMWRGGKYAGVRIGSQHKNINVTNIIYHLLSFQSCVNNKHQHIQPIDLISTLWILLVVHTPVLLITSQWRFRRSFFELWWITDRKECRNFHTIFFYHFFLPLWWASKFSSNIIFSNSCEFLSDQFTPLNEYEMFYDDLIYMIHIELFDNFGLKCDDWLCFWYHVQFAFHFWQ